MKYRVSNSKIKTWRRCPNQFRYKYIMKLEPRLKAVQLERGSWLHELLEWHYTGRDWEEIHATRTRQFYAMFEEQREELGDLPVECRRIMRAYLRHYRQEDARLRVVDAEINEIVTLPNGLEFQMILDLVVEDRTTGLLWLWDHKTRKNFERGDNMLLDPQLTNYFGGAQLLGYTPLGGVIYNEIRTKPPAVPQLLTKGGLSKRINIDTDVYTYMREIRRHGLDPSSYASVLRHLARNQHDRFFRRTKLPKDPPMVRTMRRELVQSAQEMIEGERLERFPRTFLAHDCKWSCPFKNLCIGELHGADIDSMIKADFRRRPSADDTPNKKEA